MSENEDIFETLELDVDAAIPADGDAGPANSVQESKWKSFWRKLIGWDFFVTLFSVLGLALGVVIWYQPPLFQSSSLSVECKYLGERIEGVKLYRPLSMPSRYYILLPHELRKTYRWFAVDRRHEICAISKPPALNFCGMPIIRRRDSLGQDLEFRHLDNSEWRVGFFENSIVFSNALLSVRLDKK